MVAPRSFADVVSRVVTVAFHPLLLPIYCTLLVLYTPTPYAAMPTLFKAFQLGGVCLFECIVPLAVIGVFIALGEVSGIVPGYLSDFWLYARRKSELLKETELKIENIEAVTYCQNCNKTYETVTYGKECPFCHSGNTFLVTGNQFNIKEIEAT